MVVIGIIAILMGLLLPVLSRVRQHARQVACASNLRQIGQLFLIYANANDGWVYPLGPGVTEVTRRLGMAFPPEQRWPVYVKGLERYDHPLLSCPQDEEPAAVHSYILNYNFAVHDLRFHSHDMAGLKPADFVVMGEKRTDSVFYFIAPGEFGEVDPYKHGLTRGSNYLFLDMHVNLMKGAGAESAFDPWNVPPSR